MRFPTIGEGERLADVRSGPQYGYSDFSVDHSGYATYMRITENEYIFRLRISSFRPNSKGYMVLFDIDGKFGASDPDHYQQDGNPGFELGVLFRSNADLSIVGFDSHSTCGQAIKEYDYKTHSQASIAGLSSGVDYDVFYDFYVPRSDLDNAIDSLLLSAGETSPGIRLAASTSSSNTCPFDGSISDVGGVNDNDNPCWACVF